MIDFRIANRYAKALLELANERNELDQVHKEMNNLRSLIKNNRDLKALLKSPIISTDKKEKVLHAVLKGTLGKVSMSFIDLVLSRHREGFLEDIALQLHYSYNILKHISIARVTSASKLSDEQIQRIVEMVKVKTGNQVELQTKIDPRLIGGFVIKIGDQQIDASVSRQLSDFRKEFKDNPYQIKY
jgi:F-type H+-transporting ATPase subunit delta